MMRKVLNLDQKRPLRDDLKEEGKLFLVGVIGGLIATAVPLLLIGLLQ